MTLIILIAWLYVVLMWAVTQQSLLATFAILFLLGFLPTWLVARWTRRRLQRQRERHQERMRKTRQ